MRDVPTVGYNAGMEVSLDEFQRRIVASRLVDEDDAATVRAGLSSESLEAYADLLVDKKLITPWQRRLLLDGRYKGFFIEGNYKLLEHAGCIGDRMRFLAEDIYTRKHVILSIETPKPEQPLVYDVEKLPMRTEG